MKFDVKKPFKNLAESFNTARQKVTKSQVAKAINATAIGISLSTMAYSGVLIAENMPQETPAVQLCRTEVSANQPCAPAAATETIRADARNADYQRGNAGLVAGSLGLMFSISVMEAAEDRKRNREWADRMVELNTRLSARLDAPAV